MTPQEALQLIEYIRKGKLDERWETFVSSMEQWAKCGGKITPAHAKRLNDLYCASTGHYDKIYSKIVG